MADDDILPLPSSVGVDPPRPVHSFFVVANADGSRFLQIFKRVDLRETEQVGGVLICDKGISARILGDQICAVFDMELVARGAAG